MKNCILAAIALLTSQGVLAAGNVSDTLHNLSTSGPGQVKSQIEDEVCIFCHTPHAVSAEAPQWNRRSGSGHIPYQSSTSRATPADMGSSRLCLSCHDGTIALGDLMSKMRKPGKGVGNLDNSFISGRAKLGTDLRDDHPIAISYQSQTAVRGRGRLASPAAVDLPLQNGEMHCVSCHDPHSDSTPPFLRRTTQYGELCVTCHLFDGRGWEWASSAHAISNAMPLSGDPWNERKPAWKGADVRENACMNCHATHNAAKPARLVKDQEEETCYRCHDGSTADKDIRSEIRKFFRHPVDDTPSSGHDAMNREDPLTMSLHVECEDCHNPHASRTAPPMISINPGSPSDSNHSTPPFANGSIAGVTGIDINGSFKAESNYEYEVCFKCHGVPGKNACSNRRCSTAASYDMARQDGTYNLRDKFDPGNPSLQSYHPVVQNNPANNGTQASLRPDGSLNTYSSQIYCGDCHAGDRSPAAGGTGPAGPHGSNYEGLLALRYEFDPRSSFGAAPDSLCMKCHDFGFLFSDTGFPHRLHVLEERASCINCHDPHGSAVYPHLLNFLLRANVGGRNFTIAGPGHYREPIWRDDGDRAGTCWLNCHGVEHDGKSYPWQPPENPGPE